MDLFEAALSNPLDDELGPVEVTPHYMDQRPDSGHCCSHGVLEVEHEIVAVKVAVVAALVDLVLYYVEHLVVAGSGLVEEQGEEAGEVGVPYQGQEDQNLGNQLVTVIDWGKQRNAYFTETTSWPIQSESHDVRPFVCLFVCHPCHHVRPIVWFFVCPLPKGHNDTQHQETMDLFWMKCRLQNILQFVFVPICF